MHRDIADAFLPRALEALREAGRHHPRRRAASPCTPPAPACGFADVTDDDWAAEYYSLDIAAGIVDSLDDALEHIRRWSSGHTEAIVTDSQSAAQRFIAGVDSAAVMVNASTRFTDGGEFGFGAEIGISTQKLHARGPMGLDRADDDDVRRDRATGTSAPERPRRAPRTRVCRAIAQQHARTRGGTAWSSSAPHSCSPARRPPPRGPSRRRTCSGPSRSSPSRALLVATMMIKVGGTSRPAALRLHDAAIGVMGGSFDPIHLGHLVAASEVAHRFALDRVVFSPTGEPWHKSAPRCVGGDALPHDGRGRRPTTRASTSPASTSTVPDPPTPSTPCATCRPSSRPSIPATRPSGSSSPAPMRWPTSSAGATPSGSSRKAHLIGVTRPGHVLADPGLPGGLGDPDRGARAGHLVHRHPGARRARRADHLPRARCGRATSSPSTACTPRRRAATSRERGRPAVSRRASACASRGDSWRWSRSSSSSRPSSPGLLLSRDRVADRCPHPTRPSPRPRRALLPVEEQRQVTILLSRPRPAGQGDEQRPAGRRRRHRLRLRAHAAAQPAAAHRAPRAAAGRARGRSGSVRAEEPLEVLLGVQIDATVELDRLAWAGLIDATGARVDVDARRGSRGVRARLRPGAAEAAPADRTRSASCSPGWARWLARPCPTRMPATCSPSSATGCATTSRGARRCR